MEPVTDHGFVISARRGECAVCRRAEAEHTLQPLRWEDCYEGMLCAAYLSNSRLGEPWQKHVLIVRKREADLDALILPLAVGQEPVYLRVGCMEEIAHGLYPDEYTQPMPTTEALYPLYQHLVRHASRGAGKE